MRPRFRGDSLRHLLPILAVCQILGIVAADRGWVAPDAALVAGATAVAMGGLLARSARARSSFAALAAAAAGALALGNQLGEAARGWPLEPRELAIVGTVRNATAGVHWMRVDLVDVVAADRHAAPPASRVRVIGRRSAPNTPALESALPGERRQLSVRLRAPAPRRNPGSVGWRDRLVRAGVGAEASLTHPALPVRLPEREGRRPLAALHAARIELGEALSARGPGGSLLRALALGDRRGLSSETRDDFASLGLAHLLAVSGLHLTLVASLSFAGVRMTLGRRAWLAARWDTRIPALVVGVACAAGYALLAGWGIPVRRALVLLLGLVVAVARARPGGRAPPLAAAAMAILWIQPEALFEPGAQLSFAASAALAAAVDPMPSLRRRAAHRRWLGVFATALRASATALAATAPLVAYHMAKVAPLGLVANAFAVPWTALALLPAAMLGTLAAAFPSIGTEFVSMACEHVGRVSLSAVEWAAARATGFETDARPAIPWCLGAAGIAVWVLRARTTRMRVGLALAQSALLSFAPGPQIRPPPPRVVVFDTGRSGRQAGFGSEG